MSTFKERQAKSKRKKLSVRKSTFKTESSCQFPDLSFPDRNPQAKSVDSRQAYISKSKSYDSSGFTIAPAYNKGPYMAIPRKEVIDIGR
jgi:hypothetical protein